MWRMCAIVLVTLAPSTTLLGVSTANASTVPSASSAASNSTASSASADTAGVTRTGAFRTCKGALTLPTHSNHALIDSAITCLVDRERANHRLPMLRSNRQLQGIASSLAGEMAVGGYFGDNTLTGQTPWQRIVASPYALGARSLAAAQNIGWGTGGLATPEGVVEEWMQSTPHRLIILTGGYRDVGAGVAPVAPSSLTNEKPGATYTLELAARH
jgi:uncharacterized protein YkwD